MVTNHIEALAECIESPWITEEAKTHLTALYNQMVTRKAERKPSNKTLETAKMRQVLNDNLEQGVSYTWDDFANIINTNLGTNVSNRRAMSIALGIGIEKNGETPIGTDKSTTLWVRK